MNLPINYNNAHWTVRRQAREEYIKIQKGLCYHCGNHLNGEPATHILKKPITEGLFPPNFFKWPVHLHHDHETGLTLGAVHNKCNAVLWEHHHE